MMLVIFHSGNFYSERKGREKEPGPNGTNGTKLSGLLIISMAYAGASDQETVESGHRVRLPTVVSRLFAASETRAVFCF